MKTESFFVREFQQGVPVVITLSSLQLVSERLESWLTMVALLPRHAATLSSAACAILSEKCALKRETILEWDLRKYRKLRSGKPIPHKYIPSEARNSGILSEQASAEKESEGLFVLY